jgi:hypothetical protein
MAHTLTMASTNPNEGHMLFSMSTHWWARYRSEVNKPWPNRGTGYSASSSATCLGRGGRTVGGTAWSRGGVGHAGDVRTGTRGVQTSPSALCATAKPPAVPRFAGKGEPHGRGKDGMWGAACLVR